MARFPFPIPFGWFHVAFDAEIESASIHPLDLFGRELALWRAEDGELCLQDRYCPHLGGNFAVGGQVVGQTLECPFHKWRFATDGQVAEIPYAKKLNRSACVRTYPLQVKHGIVMGWYHPQGAPPSFDLPEAPELNGGEFTPIHSTRHEIKTCMQEMGENTADSAHFHSVHKHPQAAAYDAFVCEGPVMAMDSQQVFPSSRGPVPGTLTSRTHGFGWSIVRYGTLVDVCLLTSSAPIDEETVVQHFHVSYRNPEDDPRIHRIGQAFDAEVNRQFREDIAIWESKIYQPSPQLCDGDGPVGKYRNWAKQFYLEAV
ncbi:MAG: Rieske 2Fe-2S domain-containing protein [Gammaproteobacteria bacterium]|nr:Rieske 2Fe-2S domain-containing protein [Gammaproteobacteria bacterium]